MQSNSSFFRRLLVLAAVVPTFLAFGDNGLAQDSGSSEAEIAAYRQGREDGYSEGWDACRKTSCGVGTTGSRPGTGVNFQFPSSVFPGVNPGTAGIEVPPDWYLAPSASGQGVLGKVEPDGQFRPYVLKPGGQIDLLPENQAPVWTTDRAVKDIFSSLPKGSDGVVFVPVQPSID